MTAELQIRQDEASLVAKKSVIGSPHTPFGTGSAKQSLSQNALIVSDCFRRTSFAMTALIVAGILLRQLLQLRLYCVSLILLIL